MHRIPFAQIARLDHRFRLHRRGTFLFRLLAGAPYLFGVRLETPRSGIAAHNRVALAEREGTAMANETVRLAEYAAGLRYEDLPPT